MLALWQSAMKRQMTITTQKCCAACMTWAIYNDEARSVMYPPFGPVLFQLGPLSIHWYGLIMIVAIVVACWVASRYVARHGQDSTIIWDMLLWVLVPALIGERLYYVFIQSPRGPNGLGRYLANPIENLEIWKGGMHIYGAFILGSIALVLYARIRK